MHIHLSFSSSSKKTEGSVKSWKGEPEAKRKESVIKNIGIARESSENGKISNDATWKNRVEEQANGLQKKMNFDKEEQSLLHANNLAKVSSSSRTEKRVNRGSPPISTSRTLEGRMVFYVLCSIENLFINFIDSFDRIFEVPKKRFFYCLIGKIT